MYFEQILGEGQEGIRRNFAKIESYILGPTAIPTYSGLTLTGLTANSLIYPDSNKLLTSLGVASNGQLPIGSTGATPVLAGLTGTANRVTVTNGAGSITLSTPQDIHTAASNFTVAGETITDLTATRLMYSDGSKVLSSVSDLTAWIAGTTDHISVADDSDGTVTLNLDTNTQTLLGSFNGIFLEKLNFTISESGGTVTGTLEQDGGGDLIQRFSDGYTTLDCTPAKTIDLTAYVGTNAVPKEVFIYILQSAKTAIVASNVDWPLDPEVEHIKIVHLVLKSAVTTGTDGGALMNQNHNDYAFDATGEGHLQDIEHRLRQEPAQYHSGVALTLKNAAGAELTTSNSSTAVELVAATGHIFQIHQHNFPAFDMYTEATDKADIVNQPTDEGGNYETTTDLVTDVTHYVDGTDAGVAIGVNKYFNIVIWGVMNRTGEVSFLMINLPTGQYTTSANAVADIDGTSVFDIPFPFKGTGFLIARLTFRLVGGSQWTYIAQEDLRGQIPGTSAGVGVTTTDHALLANLGFALAGHTGFLAEDGSVALAGTWDMGSQILTNVNIDSGDINTAVVNTEWDAAFAHVSADGSSHSIVGSNTTAIGLNTTHRGLTSGNPHSVTPTELGLVIGTNTQAHDAGLDSLAALSYVSDSFIKVTATDVYAIRTIAETKSDLSLNLVENTALTTWAGSTNLVTLGTIATGTWEATDVGIAHGGTGQSTAQLAINALSAVGAATNEHVLTKDTGTGNAIWKAAGGADSEKVKVDVGATADYLGAANNDGVLRTGTGLSYADGGNFVTLDLDINALTADATPQGSADYVATYDNTASTEKKVLLNNFHRFVDRGDPTGADYHETGDKSILDTDGTWHDLDLGSGGAAIVPSNAVAIMFRIAMEDDLLGADFQMRKNGNVNAWAIQNYRNIVINVLSEQMYIVACDSNQVVEYKGTNTAFTNIYLVVNGWWLA